MKVYTYAIYEDWEHEGPDPAFYWSTTEYTESQVRKIVFEVSAHFGASVTHGDNAYARELAKVMADHDLHRFVPLAISIEYRALRGYFPFDPGISTLDVPIVVDD